jgi:hypothetical protein
MPDIKTVNPKNKTWTVRELISRLEAMPQDADVIGFLSTQTLEGDDALPINQVLLTTEKPDLWEGMFSKPTVLLYL